MSAQPSITQRDLRGRSGEIMDAVEHGRRLDVLQRTENEFDPIPFGPEAARAYGRITAAVVAAGRTPRRRVADLMIAAIAVAEGLPLYTTNPGGFAGLGGLVTLVPVRRPPQRSA